jgi:hypothetical protein
VGQRPQGEVEEPGRVGLLGPAQGDLDIGDRAGGQGDPAAGASGALLAAS